MYTCYILTNQPYKSRHANWEYSTNSTSKTAIWPTQLTSIKTCLYHSNSTLFNLFEFYVILFCTVSVAKSCSHIDPIISFLYICLSLPFDLHMLMFFYSWKLRSSVGHMSLNQLALSLTQHRPICQKSLY